MLRYIQEQEAWGQFIRDNLGENAKLVNVSKFSSDSRVYESSGTIHKIRRLTPASMRNRNNSLEDECLVLKRLSSIRGVPRAHSYKRIDQWEQLEMEVLPPLQGYDPTFGRPKEALIEFWNVIQLTWELNRNGCSHGDLHRDNVGRNIQGSISIFDFDQACLDRPWRCMMRDMLGLGTCERRSEFSLFNRLRDVRGIGLVLRAVVRGSKYLLGFLSSASSSSVPNQAPEPAFMERARLRADPNLEVLANAWRLAARAHASAPGVDIGYYSIDIAGINFPGERPWMLRWDRIQKGIDFKGKQLLELGCNMGLLSIHAKLYGAKACLGIDVDKEILEAAALASRAFEVEVAHRLLDLDAPFPWEGEMKGFDIVSALSVLHWVKDKKRAWAFIARHNEVLYEGHESEQEAESNLRQAGFMHIVRLGATERNRQMFYAARS